MPMMTPSQSQVNVDPILTRTVIGYRNPIFAWINLFPSIPVNAVSGTIIRFDNSDWVHYDTRKQANAHTNRRYFQYSGDPYHCENHRIIGEVPKVHLRDAQAIGVPVSLAERAATGAYSSIVLDSELQAAELATTAANYDSSHKITLTGSDQWTSSTADIIGQVNAAKSTVQLDVGMFPNVGVFGWDAFYAAFNHPKVVERYSQTTRPSELNSLAAQSQLLGGVLGLDMIYVAQALEKNAQTNVVTRIGGTDKVVLGYAPNDGDLYTPSYGYTYRFDGYPLVEEVWEDRDKDSFCYPVSDCFATALTGPGGGYLMEDCV